MIFEQATLLPRDRVMNTFAWNFEGDGGAALTEMVVLAENYYNGGADPIAEYIGPSVNRSFMQHRFVNIDTPSEVFEVNGFSALLPPNAGDSLPLEVALVNSFASTQPGVPIRNRRGRHYIGPLAQNAVTGAIPGFPLPTANPQLIGALLAAAERITLDQVNVTWCVWSRTNDALYPIDNGFVNNEFDTQRRRGVDESGRITWGP